MRISHPARRSTKIRKHRYLDWDVVFSPEIKAYMRSENREFAFRVKHQIQLLYPYSGCETHRRKVPQGRYFIKINFIEFTFLVFITDTMPHKKNTCAFFSLFMKPFIVHMGMRLCLARIVCEYVFASSRKRDYLNANNDNSRILKLALKWRKENLKYVKWSSNQKHCKHFRVNQAFVIKWQI